MLRLSAIFIAICMVLIAGSIGAVLYFGVKLDLRTAAIIALGALIVMALYNSITSRLRDRGVLGDQIADLSRGTADLSRQMAEMSRRLAAVESRVEQTVNRARGAVDPIAAEIGELGGLVRQLAETVAAHETMLGTPNGVQHQPAATPAAAMAMAPSASAAPDEAAEVPLALKETDAVSGPRRFKNLSRE